MWHQIPWYKRLYFRARTSLLFIRARVLYGKESIPYAKELENFARFYQWLLNEIGEEPMQLLAAKYAVFVGFKPYNPNLPIYEAIASIIAHPDRIRVRFPIYDRDAEPDRRLGPLAAGMVMLAKEPGAKNRGVWGFPEAPRFDLEAATAALVKLRESRKEGTQ